MFRHMTAVNFRTSTVRNVNNSGKCGISLHKDLSLCASFPCIYSSSMMIAATIRATVMPAAGLNRALLPSYV